MNKGNHVPFYLCRPGTRLEFEVFTGEKTQGTVRALSTYGARNYLVTLSEHIDHKGVSDGGICPVTGTHKRINLDHATGVLEHGSGPLVFETEDYARQVLREELAEYRNAGVVRRRGKRLEIDGMHHYAPGVVRALVMEAVVLNVSSLPVQPWELLDVSAILRQLQQEGIVRYHYENDACETVETSAVVNTVKMKRFLERNINRFKLNLTAEQKAEEEEQRRIYEDECRREDEEYERRHPRANAVDDDDDDDFRDDEAAFNLEAELY